MLDSKSVGRHVIVSPILQCCCSHWFGGNHGLCPSFCGPPIWAAVRGLVTKTQMIHKMMILLQFNLLVGRTLKAVGC
jgi:hypothetical protein